MQWLVPDAHGAQSACDGGAVDPIPITDEVARSLIPRKCLGYLARNPFCGRICCHVDPDEISAIQPNDDEGIEQVEAKSLRRPSGLSMRNSIRDRCNHLGK